MITISVDTSELNQAMREIIWLSGKADEFVLKKTAGGVLINLVRNTTLFQRVKYRRFRWMQKWIEKTAKGRARLGWWPAWKALNVSGAPRIGNGPLRDRGEGGIVDQSANIFRPYITIFNVVPYIKAIDKEKKTLQRAVTGQLRFMLRYLDREYTKILRGRSAR